MPDAKPTLSVSEAKLTDRDKGFLALLLQNATPNYDLICTKLDINRKAAFNTWYTLRKKLGVPTSEDAKSDDPAKADKTTKANTPTKKSQKRKADAIEEEVHGDGSVSGEATPERSKQQTPNKKVKRAARKAVKAEPGDGSPVVFREPETQTDLCDVVNEEPGETKPANSGARVKMEAEANEGGATSCKAEDKSD